MEKNCSKVGESAKELFAKGGRELRRGGGKKNLWKVVGRHFFFNFRNVGLLGSKIKQQEENNGQGSSAHREYEKTEKTEFS